MKHRCACSRALSDAIEGDEETKRTGIELFVLPWEMERTRCRVVSRSSKVEWRSKSVVGDKSVKRAVGGRKTARKI